MWTLGLLALTAVAWAMGLPTSLLVLITGPATIALAIAALVHARGVKEAASVRVWLWVAAAVGALSMLAGLNLVLLRVPIEHSEACYARAITETANRECAAQLKKETQEVADRWKKAYGTRTKP